MTPKNWKNFQHYSKRKPVWIKLHRALLDDYQFACLPVASQALAPRLWLLASEYDEGRIDANLDEMAFRLHLQKTDLIEALKPLVSSGFFIDASNLLAGGYQKASLETEGETEGEREISLVRIENSNVSKTSPKKRTTDDPLFIEFYSAYPRRQSKQDAIKAYAQVRKSGVAHESIMRGLDRAKRDDRRFRDPQYTPLPASWLRSGGFEDEPNSNEQSAERLAFA